MKCFLKVLYMRVGTGGTLDRLDDTNAERFGKMLEVFHG